MEHSASMGFQKIRVLVVRSQQVAVSGQLKMAPTFTHAGSTAHFVVSFDESLGDIGQQMADAVLANCENDFTVMQDYFGLTPGNLPFTVNIVDGDHGASHASCDGTAITCDDFKGDSLTTRAAVLAEVAEVFMANKNAGWDCGASNGEALSRIMAEDVYPNL